MTKKVCAKCKDSDGIRIIIWGMPDSEPDPNKYYMCVVAPQKANGISTNVLSVAGKARKL